MYVAQAAYSELPDRRDEIIAGIQQALNHTNAWCRIVALECVRIFPEQLPRWNPRLAELAQDKDEMVQSAALNALCMMVSTRKQLEGMPEAEIHRIAEAVLANSGTTKRNREYAEWLRSHTSP
jgi:hypothetical protein